MRSRTQIAAIILFVILLNVLYTVIDTKEDRPKLIHREPKSRIVINREGTNNAELIALSRKIGYAMPQDSQLLRSIQMEIQELLDQKQLEKLKSDVYKKTNKALDKLQFGTECERILVCQIRKSCGFGCQIHHLAHCYNSAIAMKRTMVIDSNSWSYSDKGAEFIFQPFSDCPLPPNPHEIREASSSVPVVLLPIVEDYQPPYEPPNMPPDVFEQVMQFHLRPSLWWVGLILARIMNLNEKMQQIVDDQRKAWKWEGSILGMHIRRTDKIGLEAKYYDIHKYMKHAKQYFDQKQLDVRRIFVASDDPEVLSDLKKSYPSYDFISNHDSSELAGLETRYTDGSLIGVVSDIIHLSNTDYLVCTFSSQVCRLAYELMQTKHVDASLQYISLDGPYYFGGQLPTQMCVTRDYIAQSNEEHYLAIGDFVKPDSEPDESGFIVGSKNEGVRKKFPAMNAEVCMRNAFPNLF